MAASRSGRSFKSKAMINEAGETVPAPDSEIYTEETTTVERPPDAKLSQWLLERKWPELFRFGLVLENALPVVVHEPEAGLGAGVTLLGGQPKPAHRFGCRPRGRPRRWRTYPRG